MKKTQILILTVILMICSAIPVFAEEATFTVKPGEEKTFEVKDTPQSVPLKIQKIDNKKKSSIPWNDSYSLGGSIFKIDYTDGKSTNRTWYVQTKTDGTATLDDLVNNTKYKSSERYKDSKGNWTVPLGTVTVTEVEAPYGYVKSNGSIVIKIDWDGNKATNETTSNIKVTSATKGDYDTEWKMTATNPITIEVADQPQSAPLKIQKVDRETGKPVPLGGASLENAVFKVEYSSFKKGTTRTWYVKTDKNGFADLEDAHFITTEKFLQRGNVPDNTYNTYTSDERFTNFEGKYVIPLGDVKITEVEAPEGYLRNEGSLEIKIDWDGPDASKETTSNVTVVKHTPDEKDAYTANWGLTTANPLLVTVEDQVIRSDFEAIKRLVGEETIPVNLPFVVKSTTTGEYHVVATNLQGHIQTQFKDKRRDVPHTRDTNGNDNKVLDNNGKPIVDEKGIVNNSEVSYNRGTWFYKDKEGNEAKEVNDLLGALPYDTYEVTELKTEQVKAKKLIEGKELSVTEKDDNSLDDYFIFGETWDNDPDDPDDPKYEIFKIRNEEAPANEFGEGYGFKVGDKVTYNVYVQNKSIASETEDMSLTVDVSDKFVDGAEFFSTPVVKEVKNAKQNELSEDKNTVNITVAPETTATVVYEVTILEGAKEFTSIEAKDSDSLDRFGQDCNWKEQANEPNEEDGYKNEASAKNAWINGKNLENKKDPANTPVQEKPSYEIHKTRNEDANAKGKTKKYGFAHGDTVTYNVVITNTSSKASLTMDVTDQFTEHPEYFTLPVVKEVQNAVENSRSEDGNKVNITIKAGEAATVVYEAKVLNNAVEYLANAAKDSDSLDALNRDTNKVYQANKTDDKDGYRNIAKTYKVIPHKPIPEKPETPVYPDGKEVLISKANVDSEEIPGAVLVLTDKEGKVVDVWTSTTEPHMVKLNPGEYFLEETVAPEGYTVVTTFGFTVDADGNVTTTSKDAKCDGGHLTVVDHAGDTPYLEDKEDEAQTPVQETVIKVVVAKADKDKVKYYLKGAEITIFDANGKVVTDTNGKKCVGKTDKNGLVSFDVSFNSETKYYAQETKAPKGYQLNKDKFELVQMNDGTFKSKIDVKILDKAIIIPPKKAPKTGDTTTMLIFALALASVVATSTIVVRKRKTANK